MITLPQLSDQLFIRSIRKWQKRDWKCRIANDAAKVFQVGKFLDFKIVHFKSMISLVQVREDDSEWILPRDGLFLRIKKVVTFQLFGYELQVIRIQRVVGKENTWKNWYKVLHLLEAESDRLATLASRWCPNLNYIQRPTQLRWYFPTFLLTIYSIFSLLGFQFRFLGCLGVHVLNTTPLCMYESKQ